MRIGSLLTCLASLSFLPLLSALESQAPFRPDDLLHPLRVAIIGAGAAGSSAAYHLSLYSNSSHSASAPPLAITLFDPASHAGGRSTTVDALDDPAHPVELGASIFVKVNHILYNASRDFDLVTRAASGDRQRTSSGFGLGVWDGREFVFKQASDDDNDDVDKGWRDWKGWWDIAKLLWRYGLAPIRTQRMMKDSVGRFFKFYEEGIFPFPSLTRAVYETELQEYTGSTGLEVLSNGGVGESFQREIIQASTRVNYGQNLAAIHGLEAMVCMATDGAMSVKGGNWQIFQKMVEASRAVFKTNTTVTEISEDEDGAYQITSTTKDSKEDTSIASTQKFDTIILATPLQFSSISITPSSLLVHKPSPIPYVRLHVTLLTSPHRISPTFFGLESQNEVPDMILTTLPSDTFLPPTARGAAAVGPAGFWSISLLRSIQAPGQRTQFLYKVFSPTPLTGTWLSSLLDFDYTNSTPADTLADLVSSHGHKRDIPWLHEKAWHSYPYEVPRREFERLRLDAGAASEDPEAWERGGRGIWYTSGIESFISTMETSALMGKNIARLLMDEVRRGGGKVGT